MWISVEFLNITLSTSEGLVFVVFVMSLFYGFKNSRKGWKLPILWVFLKLLDVIERDG